MKVGAKRWAVLGAVLGVSGVAGCTPQMVNEQPELIAGPSLDTSNPRAKLILGSESLVGKIRISAPRFRRVGQLTKAQVTVQNLTDDRYTLEYRFGWEDSQGFKVGNPGSWYRFTLAPRQIETFSSTGKMPEATNIVFTVRLPDDVFIHMKPEDKK
jgi:uncharacterized protein YcfL